jgi:hypothetical protein
MPGGGRGGGFRGGRGGHHGVSGRQLRKERRKEERVASKKRPAPPAPSFEGHDSDVRATRRRVELFVETLRRSIAREEERLKAWSPPKTPEQLEKERLKKLGSGLRGAAKPAWERYPELYPEMHKPEEPEPTFDLISKHSPHCFAHSETRNLVGLYFQLGHAVLADDKSKTRARDSQSAFKACLKLDSADPFGSRYGFLLASLERGEVVEEWEEILASDFLEGTCEQSYTRALIELVQKSDHAQEALALAVEEFPEAGMVLLNSSIMPAYVEQGQVLAWIRDERERLVTEAVEAGTPLRSAGLSHAGRCTSAEALAIVYYVCFGSLWEEEAMQASLVEALEGVEYVDDASDDEDQQLLESEDRWMDTVLNGMFRKAAVKFATNTHEEEEVEE